MAGQDDLLTVREVARACHRTEETVRRWIWSGKLRARKIGNQHFIDPADVEALKPRSPRAAETAVAYRPTKEDKTVNYDKDKALKWLRETIALGKKISAKYGPVDVTELIRESREGLR
ncbi:MAG: helix-turn-helix domain-containing protein [Chloroflexi bacterium]|nr:helix-turn-helix domain-containing protein [Chloroflexota bacterium]